MESSPGNRKRQPLRSALIVLLFAAVGFAIGYLGARYGDAQGGVFPSSVLLTLVFLIFALVLQLILHEAGHLLFGLLSGYRFLSFRVASFLWQREGGRLRLRRLSLAGTAGQCILVPPAHDENGGFPFVWYNLGGPLINLLSALLCGGVALSLPEGWVRSFLLCLALMGLFLGLVNGIPFSGGLVNNDGHNTLSLARDPQARRAFWLQLTAQEKIAQGCRPKDLPQDWFPSAQPQAGKSALSAAIGYLACTRLLDQHRFFETAQAIEALLAADSGLLPLHRHLLIGDLVSCRLLLGGSREEADALLTKPVRKTMQAMKSYPSILRTNCLYALLARHHRQQAQKIQAQFDHIARTYPYPSEIAMEAELMALAREKEETL